ncbi:hypothetical protein GE061_016951 [Apolygus lucorum]|uniref:Uncharacterized protein n=1 Tax=Apolygus lucorum TaxID=248454 RepID=A0A8S9XHM0_APOLU|nr:hypothetical protein GE061_016951 [Apolygus lucorum]
MDKNHALNCKRGGIVKQGHDQIRDVVAGLARQAFAGVVVEPVIREGTAEQPGLIADIKVNGVWDRDWASLTRLRIVNAGADSYSTRDWDTVARETARAKHWKYDLAAEDLHGSFSPLITSCEGVLHQEFKSFCRRLVDCLADKWEKPRSVVAEFVCIKLQIGTIRAVSLRLRGSRRPLRHQGYGENRQADREEEALRVEDSAPLPLQTN